MNRITAFFVVFLSIGIVAAGQEKKPTTVVVPAKTTVYEALQAVTTVVGLGLNRTGVTLDEQLGHDVEISMPNVQAFFKELLKILDPNKYRYWIDSDGILQVAPKLVPQQAVEHAQMPQLVPPPVNLVDQHAMSTAPPQIRYSYSAAVLPDNYHGGPTWMDYKMAESEAQQRNIDALLEYQHALFQTNQLYLEPPAAIVPTSGYNSYPYVPPFYAMQFRNFELQGREGAIKTTGDVKNVELFVDGCYIGDADQFASWWNQKSTIAAGRAVKITARKGDRSFSRTVILPSVAASRAAGAHHLPFGIHASDFTGSGSGVFDQAAMDRACPESSLVIR